MAGFLDRMGVSGVRDRLVQMSKFGMKYDDLLIKNSQAIGYIEGELRKKSGAGIIRNDLLKYSMAISDTTSQLRTKTLAFFQLDFVQKLDKLRDIASNAEIEFILDTISDDTIVFDDDNKFCKPLSIEEKIEEKKGVETKEGSLNFSEEIIGKYYENFEKIYNAWGFNVGISAWQMYFQWLIEGHLSYEIIYDDINKPKEIIGFKELNPATLFPIVKKDEKGTIYLEWLQRDETMGINRTLTDAQIIYLSYSNFFRTKRQSFCERMIRSFNLLRIMEHSKVIWHVMNAPLRLKTQVPIGTKSIQKAKEDLNEFLNTFKEDIFFNQESGELLIDGKPKILFYKNYIVPINDRGEKIDISALEYPGPDLQNSELLLYFFKKLKLDSKLPFSRWDYNEGGGSYLLGPDTVTREEISYGKFIKRGRFGFQEILLKPWYLQMCLDIKALKNDYKFKNAMGLEFNNDNLFEKLKKQEIAKKGSETITTLQGIKKDTEESFFTTKYLVKEHLGMSNKDIEENEKEREIEDKEKEVEIEGEEGVEAETLEEATEEEIPEE